MPELREFEQATGVDHLGRLGVSVGFGGGLSMAMAMPEFEYIADEPPLSTEIDFGGLEAVAKFGGGGETVDLDGRFGGVDVAMLSSMQLAWGRTTWTASARQYARVPDLWLGGVETEIARVMFSTGGGESTYDVTDIRMEAESAVEGDFMVGTNVLEVGEVLIMDMVLQDLVVDFAMRHGVDALARLMDGDYIDALDPEQQMAMVNDLIRERLTFNIDRLGFTHDGRGALASLAIEFRGDELPDGFEFGPNAATAMSPLVTADLDLSFHRELLGGLGLGQMDPMVRILVREGIVQESGDDYTLDVGLANGGLTVNGDPFEPFELFGLFGP